MRVNTVLKTSFFVAVLLASLSLANPANANLTVTPETFEITSLSNQVIVNNLKITNNFKSEKIVNISVADISAEGEESEVSVTNNPKYALSPLITVSPKTLTIPAGSARFVEYVLTIPPNVPSGAKLGAVIASSDGKDLASLILVNIPSGQIAPPELISFGAKDIFNFESPKFMTRVKNSTNAYFKFAGEVSISTLFGQEIAKVNLDPKVILPEATRRAEVTWSIDKPFGIYRAEFRGVSDKNEQEVTATSYFVGLAAPPAAPVVASIIIIAGLYLYRKIKRRLSV